MKSSGGMFLKKWMLGSEWDSRKARMPFEVPSDPASTLGQNQSVGTPIPDDGVERLLDVPARCVVLRGDGVLEDDDVALGEIGPLADAPVVLEERLVVDLRLLQRPARDVDGGAAGVEHAVRALAHANHALGGSLGRDHVEVGELRHRVADLLVDRAGDLAALDVHQRDVQVGGCDGGGHGLVAVAIVTTASGRRWSNTVASSAMPKPVDLAEVTRFSPSSTM